MWHTQILTWAEECLLSKGYIVYSQSVIQSHPWSRVYKFDTSKGVVYLKQTPPELSYEPKVTQLLHETYQAPVPKIIDQNTKLRCFLTLDAGRNLRKLLQANFQSQALLQAIDCYIDIQKKSLAMTSHFLALGLPNWQMSELPKLYQYLIRKKNLLIQNGLTDDELKKLHQLTDKFTELCNFLDSYGLPSSLDHSDFQDGNIMVDHDGKITIIDWAETVITHPFFSLLNCLDNTRQRYNLDLNNLEYITIKNHCFNPWQDYIKKSNIDDIIKVARKLQPVYRAISFYRLRACSNLVEFNQWSGGHGCIANPLKQFIALNT